MNRDNRLPTLLIGAVLITSSAVAQDKAQTSDRGAEEVIVTAQKKQTKLQTTPAAITVLSAKTIAATQLQSVQGVQAQSPGLVFGSTSGYPQIALRGIGTEISGITSDAGVALNVDGVYIARLTGAGSLFDDLERVEVLRGPQGTLYGRNATGGAINIITKTPSPETSADASVLYGSYDRIKATANVEGAIGGNDNILGRLSLFMDRHDGSMFNTYTRQDVADLRSYSARGVLITKLSDDFKIAWRADWYRDSTDALPFENVVEISVIDPASGNFGITPSAPGGIFQSSLNLRPSLPLPRNGKDFANNAPSYLTHLAGGLSATAEWSIDETTSLKSITAYRQTTFGRAGDVDGSSAQILSEAYNREHSRQFSQEFNLLGSFGSGSDWIVGAYYFHDDATNYDQYNFTALARVIERATEIGGGLPLGSLSGQVSDVLLFDDKQETTSYAAFGQVNYAVTDRLKLTGGVRYTKDTKDFDETLVALGNDVCRDDKEKKSWSAVTWKGGADYKFSDETFGFVSISKGFKAGGFNLGACNNPFDPETVIAYEAGIKNRLWDGRLTLNATAFYYNYSDLQTNIYTIGGGTVQNAANAKIYGGEIELAVTPLEGLQFIGNLSLLHTAYDEFEATDPYNPLAGAQNLKGNRLERSPEWTANGVVSYTWQVENGDVNIRYEIYHTDGYFNNVHNTTDTYQKSYTLQNIRLSYAKDQWEVGAFGENIFDEIYTLNRLPIGGVGGTIATYGPRDTWGVYTRLHF